MKLNTLLQRLDQTVPLAFDTSLQNPEITSLQFDDDTTLSLHPTSLYLAVSADQTITLKGSVGKTAQLSLCAQTQLKNESQLAQLFDRAGCLLTSETSLQAQVNQLAIKAITEDFDTILNQAARTLGNPLIVLDLVGQPVAQSTQAPAIGDLTAPAITSVQVQQALKKFRPAKDLIPQVILIQQSQLPLLLLCLPLAYRNNALGYLVMPACVRPLTAEQTAFFKAEAKIITSSLIKNRMMPTAASKRDQLHTMLLTEQQSGTFAAQFAKEHAILPTSMILIKGEPRAGQSLAALKERLKYLLTPLFSQTLITLYHHQCLALVSVDLPTYNNPEFKADLATIADRANCRLIVSNQYTRPEDTIAAYAVCSRTAKLKSQPTHVTMCEDAFFDLMLAQVDHAEILPFFTNPAVKALLDHDAENKTELLPTLDAYLESGENLTHTARQLFIHLNTLRYRLKHISDITGIDLKDAETCFKLGASFKVRRYLNHNKLTFTR